MTKVKYIVYFTYRFSEGNDEYKYVEFFDKLLSKEDFIEKIESNFGNTIKVLSINKVEKETTTIEEVEL